MAAGVSILQYALLFIAIFFILQPCQARLYSVHDDIILLDNSTIHSVIYDSPVAWIVEFYSSWCGHCQAFAPTWKKLAQVARDWQSVIQVAALDCAEERNMQTCRDFHIDEYPTIKFFNASEKDRKNLGKNFKEYTKEDKTFLNLLHTMVNVVESQTQLAHPAPNFAPCTDEYVREFEAGRSKYQTLVLIFEEPYSYIGKEIALDMMKFPEVDVRRFINKKSPLLEKYRVNMKRLPLLIKFERDGRFRELSRMKRNHAEFKKALHSYDFKVKSFPPIEAVEKAMDHFSDLHHQRLGNEKHTGSSSEVYMLDMVSSLSFMIWNEVPNKPIIKNKAYLALKNFAGLVAECFPGKSSVRMFFSKLHTRLSARLFGNKMTSDYFLGLVNRIQQPGHAYLTKKHRWHACQGSKAQYRGYPCSLWTLFHTLTVNCGSKRKANGEEDDGLKTLSYIRDYIKNFFGCTSCVKHFTDMAKNIENEVTTHDDAILWLWEGHNKANKRLHNKPSEDPAHPKIQFPSPEMCKDCHKKDGSWNRKVVLQFLKNHYGVDNIRIKPPANVPAELEDVDQEFADYFTHETNDNPDQNDDSPQAAYRKSDPFMETI
ncbi:sulfhydryl oxidase 1-like isoform X2 [Actinia tenebrosa]|uniref:Sulfhydryl oxidase n=1 Tax=Actinia tenebrosa TaxID=6105 RepID=A0A6P8I035_ACTTE|nr:sulfhydryl oxidase 1-like isoform X2 [Actinia tenebrosa]